MVSLYCAVVGEAGSAFLIDIHKEQSVGQLKDEIKKKKSATIECDANMLQLFLAKKNGVWLTEAEVMEGVSDTTGLEPLKAARASLRFVGLSDEDVGGVNEADAAAGKGPVNVLVVVPEQDTPGKRLFADFAYYDRTHAKTTLTKRDGNFKDELCKFYGCYRRNRKWVRCMLLGITFPKAIVTASHLFPRGSEHIAPLVVQIPNLDDMKNGLLLFKPLEYAFDHFQLSLIRDDKGVYHLMLFDPNIRNTRLIDLTGPRRSKRCT